MQRVMDKVGSIEDSVSRLELESDSLKPLLKLSE
jgi:hypothetical protein